MYLKELARLIFLGSTAQALLALSSLILNIYLIKNVSPDEFGFFGIWLASSLFCSGAISSLVCVPMIAGYSELESDEVTPYYAKFLKCAFYISLLLVLFCFLAYLSLGYYLALSFLLAAAVFPQLFREFFVRKSYMKGQDKHAIIINLTFSATLLVTVLWWTLFDSDVDVPRAVQAFASSSLISIIVAVLIDPPSKHHLSHVDPITAIASVGPRGLLSFFSHIVVFFRSQGHILLVTAYAGTSGLGVLNASRIVIAPAAVLGLAFNQVFVPRLTAAYTVNSVREFNQRALLIAASLLCLTSLYLVFTWFLMPQIRDVLFLEDYSAASALVGLWMTFSVASALRSGQEIKILGMRRFKLQAWSSVVGGSALLVGSITMMPIYGLEGGLWALIAAEFIVFIMLLAQRKIHAE